MMTSWSPRPWLFVERGREEFTGILTITPPPRLSPATSRASASCGGSKPPHLSGCGGGHPCCDPPVAVMHDRPTPQLIFCGVGRLQARAIGRPGSQIALHHRGAHADLSSAATRFLHRWWLRHRGLVSVGRDQAGIDAEAVAAHQAFINAALQTDAFRKSLGCAEPVHLLLRQAHPAPRTARGKRPLWRMRSCHRKCGCSWKP